MGWIELASEQPLDGPQARSLAMCRDSADRLLRISKRRGRARQSFPAVGPRVRFARHGRRGRRDYAPARRSRSVQFHSFVDTTAPIWVIADREATQDMLRRILENSVRFTRKGILTLRVKASAPVENSATVVFEIFDTGPGIPKEVIDELQSPAGILPCMVWDWKLYAAAPWR